MSVHPPRRIRTFDGGARVYFYETQALTPPTADGIQGDWAVLLTPAGTLTFGPKTDETTWPAAAVAPGPAGPSIATWAAATAYAAGAQVIFGTSTYSAISSHTSSADIRTDIATGKWLLLNTSTQGRIETLNPGLVSGFLVWPVASRIYYYRVNGAGAIGHIGLEVGIQSGNLVVAAWRNNGSQGRSAAPATLIASSGSVAVPAVGESTISLGSTIGVADGDWFSLACDNTTAKFRTIGAAAGAGVSTGKVGFELLTGLVLPTAPAPTWAPTFMAWMDGET